jgi:hypothetical protein
MSNVHEYVNELVMKHLGSAAAGHNIELAMEAPGMTPYAEGVSLIFNETRVYFSSGILEGENLGIVQFIAPIYRDFSPSKKLVEAVAYTSKLLVAVSLVNLGNQIDLVVTADLLLTQSTEVDSRNMAMYLETIHEVHSTLWEEFESL